MTGLFFFFNDTATTEIYTLSLHDALPISYGERPGARWLARALDLGGHEIWHDTVALAGTQELSSGVAQLAPGVLPVGAGRFEIGRVGSAATHTAPFLVSFSDQWAITNYDQMISLLRY